LHVQHTVPPSTNPITTFAPHRRGRSPRLRTNIPQVRGTGTTELRQSEIRPPTAYQVMYAKNPSAADVAALAGHRIAEVSQDDPRRAIVIGLLSIIRNYLLTMDLKEIARRAILSTPLGSKKQVDLETRARRTVFAYRDLIGAIRGGIPAQTFLSRARNHLDDAKAFRVAVELATGTTLLHEHEDDSHDDTNFKLGRDEVLKAYAEPDLTAPDAK
jgi:hypothetical protein